MTRAVLCCVFIFAVVAATAPVRSEEMAANDQRVLPGGSAPTTSAEGDCETRMGKLDASRAEGEDRLREKYAVIDACADQYKNDKTIERLVKECGKYVEQPVLKQQFAAECMLAAFSYANALYALKAEHGK